MTAQGALAAALGSAILSFLFKLFWLALPFIDRVGLVFLLCVAVAVGTSLFYPPNREGQGHAIDHRTIDYGTTVGFNMAALGVILVLAAIYATWW